MTGQHFEFEKPGDNYRTSAMMCGPMDNLRTAQFEVEVYILSDWFPIELPEFQRELLKAELIAQYRLEHESEKARGYVEDFVFLQYRF